MRFKLAIGLATAALLLAAAPHAFAQETAAGIEVSNTATINFKVNNVSQTPTTAAADFLVDRKIDIEVTEVGGLPTLVTPGQGGQALTFLVKNSSNDVIDVGLYASNANSNQVFLGGAGTTDDLTDNIQSGADFKYYVDDNGTPDDNNPATTTDTGDDDGILTISGAGADTEITYLDQIPAGGQRTVFVVVTMPVGVADGKIAVISLTGTALSGYANGDQGKEASLRTAGTGTKGEALNEDTNGDDVGTVENVYADAADTEGTGDAAGNGKDASYDAYKVESKITVAKKSAVYWDPVNGTSDPKAIPGAAVLYCISVINSNTSAGASAITISDNVPSETTFVDEDLDLDADGAGTDYATPALGIVATNAIRFGDSADCTATAWDNAEAEDIDTEATDTDGKYGNLTGTTVSTTVDALAAAPDTSTAAVTTTMFMVKVK